MACSTGIDPGWTEGDGYRYMAGHLPAVYVGTVLERIEGPPERHEVRFRLRVDRSLKAAIVDSQRVVVTPASGPACGADLQVGRRAFVAEEDGGRVSSGGATHHDVDGRVAKYLRYNRALAETGGSSDLALLAGLTVLTALGARRASA